MCVDVGGFLFCYSKGRTTICSLVTGVKTCALPICYARAVAKGARQPCDRNARHRNAGAGGTRPLCPTGTAVPLWRGGASDDRGGRHASLPAAGGTLAVAASGTSAGRDGRAGRSGGDDHKQIRRASCRERVCTDVLYLGACESLIKQQRDNSKDDNKN